MKSKVKVEDVFTRYANFLAYKKNKKTNNIINHTNYIDFIDCSICLTKILRVDLFETICGHKFHYICLKKWLESKKTCPICRNHLNYANQKNFNEALAIYGEQPNLASLDGIFSIINR